MFDNKKIKFIRNLPEGSDILLCWIMLLTSAGKCNTNGFIFLTENVPYTIDMLSNEFNIPLNTIRLAIETFKNLRMINEENGVLCVSAWEEYQNIEGMDKIREQNRLRKQNERERKKLLAIGHVTVTHGHAIDKEIEEEKEIEKEYIPYQEIMDYFNQICVSLPRIREVTSPRKKAIKARWAQLNKNIDECNDFFRQVEQSDWLSGRNDKGWKASFDWIFKAANFTKIVEGNFINKQPKRQAAKIVSAADAISSFFGGANGANNQRTADGSTEEGEDITTIDVSFSECED